MALHIGSAIIVMIAIGVFVWSLRMTGQHLKVVIRVGASVIAIAAIVFLLWPTAVTLHRTASIPDTTTLLYVSQQDDGTSFPEREISSSYSARNAVVHAIRGTDGSEMWHRDLPPSSITQLYQGMILTWDAGQQTGTLTALRVHDGSRLWQIRDLPQQSQLSLTDSTAYFLSHTSGHLAAYSLTTQQQLWSSSIPPAHEMQLITTPHFVMVLNGESDRQTITLFNAPDGMVLWQQQHHDPTGQMRGVILADQVVVSTLTMLRAYDSLTGRVRWELKFLPDPEINNLVVGLYSLIASAGTILGVEGGNLFAWKAATGEPVWQKRITRTPIVDQTIVYLSSPLAIGAYNIQTGAERWSVQDNQLPWFSQILGADVISAYSTSLVLRNLTTGNAHAHLSAPNKNIEWRTPYRMGDTLFVATHDRGPNFDCWVPCNTNNALFAYDLLDGQILWEVRPTWFQDYTSVFFLGMVGTE